MKFRPFVPIPFGGTLGVLWGYFGGIGVSIWGYVIENLKFRPPGVHCHQPATDFPLVYLSPLLTVMKEFTIFVLYSLVNILKIDPW